MRRAYELDAFGEPVWGVIGPLLVVDTSDAVAPPEGWTSVSYDTVYVVQPNPKEPVDHTASELEYLRWFYQECDFGPAHDDVVDIMNTQFVERTGKALPPGYDPEEEE